MVGKDSEHPIERGHGLVKNGPSVATLACPIVLFEKMLELVGVDRHHGGIGTIPVAKMEAVPDMMLHMIIAAAIPIPIDEIPEFKTHRVESVENV